MEEEASRLLAEERPRLLERKPDGDLGLEKEDVGGVSGARVSELERLALVLNDGSERGVLDSGMLLEGESLGDLGVCSGSWGSSISLGPPCSCSDEGGIDVAVQVAESSSSPMVSNITRRLLYNGCAKT